MKVPVITLTGKTENALLALDIILANYFKALKSSSTIIQSEVCSLVYDIRSARNVSQMQTKITDSLLQLVSYHFNDVEVSVGVTDTGSNYELTIAVSAVDNGVTINVGRLVTSDSTRILKIVNISDKGSL